MIYIVKLLMFIPIGLILLLMSFVFWDNTYMDLNDEIFEYIIRNRRD